MNQLEEITRNLPDAESAERFFAHFSERNPLDAKKLLKNKSLLSDILTLVSFSPLFATTLLQNPQYVWWISRQRKEAKIRNKEELLESLARFSLTNSEVEPSVLLARFRRRELLRIYLRDIRRLGTIAEITEEISNLADAILEHALRLARQETENRFGQPMEIGEKGKTKPAKFCVVALGKLGSNELNYSSDIDLVFLYSAEGSTSGQGSRGSVTNREYFVKLSELIVKIVGGQSGEGATYRVDLRLRPHGRVGALAISVGDAIKYYKASAQAWERQTLIRSRACAGDSELFKEFFDAVENSVFSKDETVENALRNVRLSKEKINQEHGGGKGFNVKLGAGGIREIEFIAQALQLAFGGNDRWLRAPHTLISLARLTDRKIISDNELTALSDAYDFLRRVEHRLQMENGLQTHILPDETDKKNLVARRMNFAGAKEFEAQLAFHTRNVASVFNRVFSETDFAESDFSKEIFAEEIHVTDAEFISADEKKPDLPPQIISALEKTDFPISLSEEKFSALKKFCAVSKTFSEILAANPFLIADLPTESDEFTLKNYREILSASVAKEPDFSRRLAELRKTWSRLFLEIAAFDVFEKIDLQTAKNLQTELAEASVAVALDIAETEAKKLFEFADKLNLSVFGLGKLGGRGMDYGSDLDLILTFSDSAERRALYAKAAEIFVGVLSNFTREGNLYRVDLRLRPDGKNGAICLPNDAFLNYLKINSAIWEWLAYVKLRAVGDSDSSIEPEARKIIHENAKKVSVEDLKSETRSVRERLEKMKTQSAKDLNIKFGAGGLLDIYFAMRFLQLRDSVFDEAENRSTHRMLEKLKESNSLDEADFQAFYDGYDFLSTLDHNLRLTVGRTNRVPLGDARALETIAERMKISTPKELIEKLTFHRIAVREAFEKVTD